MTIRRLLCLLMAFSGPATAAGDCRAIDGIDSLLAPGRVLLLGELHGTNESPAFVLDVVCHAARAGLPVVVGLELSPGEQEPVDRFLASAGTETDRKRLLAGAIWQRDYQDGRNSRAMVDLIDGLRRLRQEGAAVRAALFDASGAGGGQQRERGLADHLARVVAEAKDGMVVVLTGNRHSRVTKGAPRDVDFEPMGYLLSRTIAAGTLIALDVGHGGGDAWLCTPGCGVTDLGGAHGRRSWAIEIDEATRPAGHHGWYHVGHISASLPARMAEQSVSQVRRKTPPAAPAPVPAGAGSGKDAPQNAPAGPLSAAASKLQGHWQAFDYASGSRMWKFHFDGHRFRADGGVDDWYEGRVELRDDREPAQMDFLIEDCRCSYKGMTSEGIFLWDDASLIIAAPRPGSSRPTHFIRDSGQMMRLERAKAD